ncbi:hypothetical protein PHLCEN_2v9686 [Hermanssonia centrifuga]|uniref:lytic cellulose monooxygenase (C4-dehydrogenating) n=1 Tax=Hermanssonia centrifuga TaxID=98765 RepID=A0A2R6NQ54_9APHY|nr:hypothetical protein PHLCEN_2v9686 [Hermanssonia centrifuga]
MDTSPLSILEVKYTQGGIPTLTHHLGPVDHYMASCEGSCTQFDATNAKWFKLDEDGYDNGVWASTKLIQNNLSASTTIPADLKPGEYLIRHEIQVKVTGSGTQSPSSADLVDIPGVYDTTVFPDIWADSFHSFANPGPPVAFSSSGSNTGSEPVVSSSIAVPSSSSHVASSSVASSSKAPAQTSSVPSARPSPSSSVVSPPSQTSTGNGTCRSRKVRRQATSERSVRHQARGKRHH